MKVERRECALLASAFAAGSRRWMRVGGLPRRDDAGADKMRWFELDWEEHCVRVRGRGR
jgi:hypothetical protein